MFTIYHLSGELVELLYVLPGVSRQYIRFKSRDQTLLTQTCRASLNLAKAVPFFFPEPSGGFPLVQSF